MGFQRQIQLSLVMLVATNILFLSLYADAGCVSDIISTVTEKNVILNIDNRREIKS